MNQLDVYGEGAVFATLPYSEMTQGPPHAIIQGHPQAFPPYVTPQQMIELYQQPALHLNQARMSTSKQAEPKPRLSKPEVERLEQEFAKNPKPSGNTKRELAEKIGIELPRINNWFQNRRAKEKHIRKTMEIDQQAKENTTCESKSLCADRDQGSSAGEEKVVSEYNGISNRHQPSGPSSAALKDDNDQDNDKTQTPCEGRLELSRSPPQDQQPIARAEANMSSDTYVAPEPRHLSFSSSAHEIGPVMEDAIDALVHHHHTDALVSHSSAAPSALHADQPISSVGIDLPLSEPSASSTQDTLMLNMAYHPDVISNLMQTGFLPSSATPMSSPVGPPDMSAAFSVAQPEMASGIMAANTAPDIACQFGGQCHMDQDALSPKSLGPSQSPPPSMHMRFKSPPPPADIAARRKIRQPLALASGALRASFGPKLGIDIPRRCDAGSPIRRVSAVTGPTLSGKIRKSSLAPAPRSPFLSEANREALMQSVHESLSPTSASFMSALTPVTPDSVVSFYQAMRENTVSSQSSDELKGTADAAMPNWMGTAVMETPPRTPSLAQGYPNSMMLVDASEQAGWNMLAGDHPTTLHTPGLTPGLSIGTSEFDLSMSSVLPGYLASQPSTPSFPPSSAGPTCQHFGAADSVNPEYTFPNSYYPDAPAMSSPDQMSATLYQFPQNVAPCDFNVERQ